MNVFKIILFILMISLGVLMFVFAGIDDSPGGQLLGVIVIIFGVIKLVKIVKKHFMS